MIINDIKISKKDIDKILKRLIPGIEKIKWDKSHTAILGVNEKSWKLCRWKESKFYKTKIKKPEASIVFLKGRKYLILK